MMSGITSGVVSQSMQGRRGRPMMPVPVGRGYPDFLPFVETSRDNQNEIVSRDNRRGYYAQPPNARENVAQKMNPGNNILEGNANMDMELNMNELSMETQLLMSEAKTVEEFARIMGIEMPRLNVTVASYPGIVERSGGSSDDGEHHDILPHDWYDCMTA
ncbi:uncharacterized protein LOC125177545 [Hyalella azteca]|uniref:Uncharacterized protein LOC125177545 n=1 Tax=Hyalella azteca TaxID=294128 RepID=A0A979FKT7_HYAAZ|nr:uncharacterized protein LOC125177545 [Hyalella azteca]